MPFQPRGGLLLVDGDLAVPVGAHSDGRHLLGPVGLLRLLLLPRGELLYPLRQFLALGLCLVRLCDKLLTLVFERILRVLEPVEPHMHLLLSLPGFGDLPAELLQLLEEGVVLLLHARRRRRRSAPAAEPPHAEMEARLLLARRHPPVAVVLHPAARLPRLLLLPGLEVKAQRLDGAVHSDLWHQPALRLAHALGAAAQRHEGELPRVGVWADAHAPTFGRKMAMSGCS